MPSLSVEKDLLSALEEGSETLQDISDQFCPLMTRFRIFFFWEQEKSDLTALNRKDYIVTEASAAPIIDATERCGIAADHSSMCKFTKPSDQGFRDVMAALKRYVRDAPTLIAQRRSREQEVLIQQRRDEAMENMGYYNHAGGVQRSTVPGYGHDLVFSNHKTPSQAGGTGETFTIETAHKSEGLGAQHTQDDAVNQTEPVVRNE